MAQYILTLPPAPDCPSDLATVLEKLGLQPEVAVVVFPKCHGRDTHLTEDDIEAIKVAAPGVEVINYATA